ncbi:hypothetical protein Nepgr_012413 [Nepenthes gracilis]|uniref:Uncharacterized protein n=1 Tax=Nepenthes gracilis TaxID=150966 RepID=A0AAD3XMS4_NEPGR|nr:hypothetical protein Nepgr_012413 [Nepenthes gracilis]
MSRDEELEVSARISEGDTLSRASEGEEKETVIGFGSEQMTFANLVTEEAETEIGQYEFLEWMPGLHRISCLHLFADLADSTGLLSFSE